MFSDKVEVKSMSELQILLQNSAVFIQITFKSIPGVTDTDVWAFSVKVTAQCNDLKVIWINTNCFVTILVILTHFLYYYTIQKSTAICI